MSPAVDPDRVARGTEVTFSGRGWAPDSQVSAAYGSYCPPTGEICAGVGLSTRLETDAHGRFALHIRYDSHDPTGVDGPVASGSEEVLFGGRAPDGHFVSRHPLAVPPPSTPEQRRQATAVARAVRGLARAVDRRRPTTNRAAHGYERQIDRCQAILRAKHGRRVDAIIDRVVDAASDAATYGVDHEAFVAYGRHLRAARVTDRILAAGVAAWLRVIERPRYVPRPSLCAVLRRWRAQDFRASAAPRPGGPGLDEEVRGSRAIRVAAVRLRALGIRPQTQSLFAGDVLGLERYIVP
jgi:hypothetical protein